MTTVKYKNCNLCGLPVEIEGFSQMTDQGQLSFCCAGCQSIYGLIYSNNPAVDSKSSHKNNTNNNEEN